MGSHFGVGAAPILVYFSGDCDVHRGYDLDFDPWPHRLKSPFFEGRFWGDVCRGSAAHAWQVPWPMLLIWRF